jgi:hypothetical protein
VQLAGRIAVGEITTGHQHGVGKTHARTLDELATHRSGRLNPNPPIRPVRGQPTANAEAVDGQKAVGASTQIFAELHARDWNLM